MNNRKKLDAVMAVLMICAMSYQATGNLFHEAAGVILLLLFIIHNVLNRKWYRSLPRGKYSRYRKVLLGVNLLTLLSMLAAMGTGIYLSQSIFAPLWGMREAYLLRPLHVAAGSWGTILVAVHGGMHIRFPAQRKAILTVVGLAVGILGIWAFVALDMPARLFFQDRGLYWSYPALVLFLANAGVMALFAGLASAGAAWLKKERKEKSTRSVYS